MERVGHYFEARLYDQFDPLIYFDQTRRRAAGPYRWIGESGDPPETYPTGL